MKVLILLLLLACKNPVTFEMRSPVVPADTVVAPIGGPPDFPEVK